MKAICATPVGAASAPVGATAGSGSGGREYNGEYDTENKQGPA